MRVLLAGASADRTSLSRSSNTGLAPAEAPEDRKALHRAPEIGTKRRGSSDLAERDVGHIHERLPLDIHRYAPLRRLIGRGEPVGREFLEPWAIRPSRRGVRTDPQVGMGERRDLVDAASPVAVAVPAARVGWFLARALLHDGTPVGGDVIDVQTSLEQKVVGDVSDRLE